jgi:hypothetical protein
MVAHCSRDCSWQVSRDSGVGSEMIYLLHECDETVQDGSNKNILLWGNDQPCMLGVLLKSKRV